MYAFHIVMFYIGMHLNMFSDIDHCCVLCLAYSLNVYLITEGLPIAIFLGVCVCVCV